MNVAGNRARSHFWRVGGRKKTGRVQLLCYTLIFPNDRQTKTLLDALLNHAFAVARDGIWFISMPEAHRRYLRFRNFSSGATRTVAVIEKPVSWGLTVSPDGRSVLFAQVDQSGSDLMLINNFR